MYEASHRSLSITLFVTIASEAFQREPKRVRSKMLDCFSVAKLVHQNASRVT